MKSGEQPHLMRRCIACRKPERKGALLRFIAAGGRLVWDREQRLPGRGAYLHPTPSCGRLGLHVAGWKRALRVDEIDVSVLETVGPITPPAAVHDRQEPAGRKIRL